MAVPRNQPVHDDLRFSDSAVLHPMTPISLLNDETGVTAIEYALLGMLLAVVFAGAVALGGTQLSELYRTVCSAASAVTGGGAC